LEKRSKRRWCTLETRTRLILDYLHFDSVVTNQIVRCQSQSKSDIMDAIVDVSNKPKIKREAVATGLLKLSKNSLNKIGEGKTKKGDVLEASTIAVIQAIKETSRMIPHCHNIPIEGSKVEWAVEENGLRCTVSVIAIWNTGVEMEALCGVSNGLLCALDMLKSIEKDSDGQYPEAKITDIRVVKKIKY